MNAKIALVCGSWPPIKCGVGDFSHRLAQELARQGRSVVAITDATAGSDNASGVTVHASIRSWRPLALPGILTAVRRTGATVVNLHYPTEQYGRLSAVDLLPLALRAALRLPVVTTIHEYTTYTGLGRRRVQTLLRSSNAVIVPDPDNLRALSAASPRLASRLHYVPLGPVIEPGAPPDFDRAAWRTAQGVPSRALVLVYFGFISASKGLDVLIDAFNRLPAGRDVVLWLLADRAPSHRRYAAYHAMIAQQVAESPRARQILWPGYLPVAELSCYLAAADLAIFPFADGATLRRTTLLAALAHGLPVLSTGIQAPCSGIRVTPIGDVPALAEAIADFERDRSALAALAAQAAIAARDFAWPTIAHRTAAILDGVARHG